MVKRKMLFLIVAILLVAGLGVLIFSKTNIKDSNSNKIQVVTTLFPLYDMARYIGGDKIDATLLLPPGVEPHTYDPTPNDIVKINTSDVFVYTGQFMEPWAADVIKGVSNKDLLVVDASTGTSMIPGVAHDADEPVGSLDPHIWLDFDNAKIMAANVEKALAKKDPGNQAYYEQQLAKYDNELTNIDSQYRSALYKCQSQEVIYAGHYAFGYLTNRYGLKYTAAQGVSPDAEPTAKDLTNLVDQIRHDGIKYLFYEELTSPKIAETIASETNAKLLLLNAGHNLSRDQFETGVTFFDILKGDLANLKIGLECQR